MKRILLLLLCACGCASHTQITYHTAVDVRPGEKAGQYEVAGRVTQVTRTERSGFVASASQKTSVLASPTMIVESDKRGTVTITPDDGPRALKMEARITGPDSRDPTACSITVRHGDQLLAGSTFTLLHKRPEKAATPPEAP
ncbi:MAG: hypothetical protein ACOC8E_07110 [Planctomycetota bacterium]